MVVPMLDQGGLERVCALTGQLLKEAFRVTIVVFNARGMIYDVSGVELINLDLGSKQGKFNKILQVVKRVKQVRSIRKERNVEVSYSFGPTANLVNVLSKGVGRTWIGIRGYGALQSKKNMRITCNLADEIICCTQMMTDEVQKMFPKKQVATLYNPCDMEEIITLSEEPIEEQYRSFFEKSGPILTTMGRVHDVKGYWHMLKAFKLVQEKIPNAKFFFVGAGDFSEYRQLAMDLGIEDRVLFLGVQKNPFRYLKYASVYLLASESEGFPNALLEAMAVGVPAVSVNCKTGPAEILTADYKKVNKSDEIYYGEYGVLLPVMNPVKNLQTDIEAEEKIMAAEIEKLLCEGERYQTYKDKIRERVSEFSNQKYRETLIRMMQEDSKGNVNPRL